MNNKIIISTLLLALLSGCSEADTPVPEAEECEPEVKEVEVIKEVEKDCPTKTETEIVTVKEVEEVIKEVEANCPEDTSSTYRAVLRECQADLQEAGEDTDACLRDRNNCLSDLNQAENDLQSCEASKNGFIGQLSTCNMSLNSCKSGFKTCLDELDACPDLISMTDEELETLAEDVQDELDARADMGAAGAAGAPAE